MDSKNVETVKQIISVCYSIYEQHSWLINCYVLDFFTENHWDKLPLNWQENLKSLDAFDLANILDYNEPLRVWPLSIIALKTILVSSHLSRKTIHLDLEIPFFNEDEKMFKLFWKNVKLKKRHEISIMSKICYESAKQTKCFYIVDIGSGLGHLSRILNYGYKFKVCTIEAQDALSQQAGYKLHYQQFNTFYRHLDEEFELVLRRKFQNYCDKTVHLHKKLETTITSNEFLEIVSKAFKIDSTDFKFGIVGLHPCGDLGATLLRLYNECSQVQFINVVGCCYMKLTTPGFPLSNFCRNNKFNLSYHSREIACHAIENYVDKLRQNECWKLKIHTYRAVLEKLLTEKWSQYRHSALNNVKYSEDLTFDDYCRKATRKLKLNFSEENLQSDEITNLLDQWKEVVVFYSLRLLFAPIIESIILLDRFIYVVESGMSKYMSDISKYQVLIRRYLMYQINDITIS